MYGLKPVPFTKIPYRSPRSWTDSQKTHMLHNSNSIAAMVMVWYTNAVWRGRSKPPGGFVEVRVNSGEMSIAGLPFSKSYKLWFTPVPRALKFPCALGGGHSCPTFLT